MTMTTPREYYFLITAKRVGSLGVSGTYSAHRSGANVQDAIDKLYDEFEHIATVTCTNIVTEDGQNAWPHMAAAYDGHGLLRAMFQYTPEQLAELPRLAIARETFGCPRQRQFPEHNEFVWIETNGAIGVMGLAARWDGEAWFNREGRAINAVVYSWDADKIHPSRRAYEPQTADTTAATATPEQPAA